MKAANGEEKAPFIPWDEECELPKPAAETISKRAEEIEKQQEAPLAEAEQAEDEEEAGSYTNLEELD